MAYQRTIGNLWVATLNGEAASRTCGPYYYLVRQGGCTPVTAFRERGHLQLWLEQRGLQLDGALPEHGVPGFVHILGQYREILHGTYAEVQQQPGPEIFHLNNGRYTTARITEDEDGIRTVHVPNCNDRNRPEHDYQHARALVG